MKSVPPNWKIWLGDFLGKDEGWRQKYSHTGAIMHRTDRPVPTIPNCQTTTFVLNELFMHASSMPEFIQDDWTPSPELVQIWPPSGKDIKWPPSFPLSDDAAGKIAYRLRNEMLTTTMAKAAYFHIEPEYYNKLKIPH